MVTQGHRFLYQSKARMQLPINNFHPLSRRFQVIADYWSNFRFQLGVPLFNALVRGEPLNSLRRNLASIKLETSLHCVVQNAFQYLEPFRRGSRV